MTTSDIVPYDARWPVAFIQERDAECSERFGDVFQYFLKLIHRKNSWFTFPLRTVLNAYEAHGVECIWDQFAAHRSVTSYAHQILEMGLALRREGKFLQPVFDRKRFDLVERTSTPLWLYVVLQPGSIARCGRCATSA